MNYILNLYIILTFFTSLSQEEPPKTLQKDLFENSYSINDNTFYKKHTDKKLKTYTNFTLGNITSFDIINPLKIVLFYRDFNTVILLDNQLNLIKKIQFQETISFAKKGVSNTLWIYNTDIQKLQLYDYQSKKTPISSLIISDFKPVKMDANFNTVKLIGIHKTLLFDKYLNLTDAIIHQKKD